jgi:hypothetical protein
MRTMWWSFIASTFLVIILRCSENKPTRFKEEDFAYPLKVGHTWEYVRESSTFNFRSHAADIIRSDTTTFSNVVMKIVGIDTLRDSIHTFVFYEQLTDMENRTSRSWSYYHGQDDGLYLVAYKDPGHVIPKSLAKKRFSFKGRYFSEIWEITSAVEKGILSGNQRLDSLYYEDPPLKSLHYPLKTGSQWIYREGQDSWKIETKVLGKEKVQVPAGEFICYKLQWLFDMNADEEWDDDIEFFDFVCPRGLIRREILLTDVGWLQVDSPHEPMALVDMKDEFQLLDVHLEQAK